MAIHNELGSEGERAACSYLVSKGYTILFQNWRIGKHELDIIATNRGKLVAVEVKTRSARVSETGNVMSRNKEKSLIEAVNTYLQLQDDELDCQIDLMIMEKKEVGFNVTHIEHAIGQE
jgi:putative endonuclease